MVCGEESFRILWAWCDGGEMYIYFKSHLPNSAETGESTPYCISFNCASDFIGCSVLLTRIERLACTYNFPLSSCPPPRQIVLGCTCEQCRSSIRGKRSIPRQIGPQDHSRRRSISHPVLLIRIYLAHFRHPLTSGQIKRSGDV